MDASIHLNNQTCCPAIKVHDKIINDLLTSDEMFF